MARVEFPQFGGMVPRLDSQKLEPYQASDAVNCNFNGMTLKPMFTYEPEPLTDIMEAKGQTLSYTGSQLLSLDGWETIIPPPDDGPTARFYYTEGGKAYCSRIIDIGTHLNYNVTIPAPSGAGLVLGIEPPTEAVSAVESNGEDPNTDLTDDETRFYVYTFVNEYGWESPPSPVSNELLVTKVGSDIEIRWTDDFMADRDITAEKLSTLRLYRSATSAETAGFFLVKEFSLPLANDVAIVAKQVVEAPTGGSGDTFTAGSTTTLQSGPATWSTSGARFTGTIPEAGDLEKCFEWTSNGGGTVSVSAHAVSHSSYTSGEEFLPPTMVIKINGTTQNSGGFGYQAGTAAGADLSIDIPVSNGDLVEVYFRGATIITGWSGGEPLHSIVDVDITESAITAGTVTGGTPGDPGSTTDYLTYADTVEVGDLGAQLVSENHYPPEGPIHGLLYSSFGIMFAWSDDGRINVSDTYLPYAFDPANGLKIEGKVMGMGETYSGIVVVTDRKPYFISGTTPDSLNMVQFDAAFACYDGGVNWDNAPHVVDMGEAVMYLSYEGVVAVSSNGAQLASMPVWAPEDLQPFMNSKLFALRFQGKYLLFIDDGTQKALIFDPASREVTEWTGVGGDAAYFHSPSDQLFTWDGTNAKVVKAADFSQDYWTRPLVSYTWESKEFIGPEVSFACAKLEGTDFSTNTVTFTLTYDDGSTFQHLVNSASGLDTFRLPAQRTRRFKVRMEGKGEVQRLVLATNMEELQ